jgi:3-deoxy-7-phosphoheptulonate synthase
MVVVMAADATASEVDNVVNVVNEAGGEAFASRGESRTIIGVSGDLERFSATLNLAGQPGVADVVRISVPYKLVSREHRRERSVIRVAGVPIGPDTLTVIAGPCAVETPEQTLSAARMARAAGASLLCGGAFKPRSSPCAFAGLGEAGLKILADVRAETGLPIVTEVVDVRDVGLVASYADMLGVGTRNMQNFPLLQAVGAAGKPVMLKRGRAATIEEWLMAAEYIAQRGNLDIVLCERGIRTFENATRNTLDIAAVPITQRLSHLPVIVDPSHSGGRRGRHHRRRAPAPGDRALRRPAGAHRVRPARARQHRAPPVPPRRPHADSRAAASGSRAALAPPSEKCAEGVRATVRSSE